MELCAKDWLQPPPANKAGSWQQDMIKRQRVVFRAFRHHPAMPTRLGVGDGDDGDEGEDDGDEKDEGDAEDDADTGDGAGAGGKKSAMKKAMKSAMKKAPAKSKTGKGKPWHFAEATQLDFLRMLTIEGTYENVQDVKKMTSYSGSSRF